MILFRSFYYRGSEFFSDGSSSADPDDQRCPDGLGASLQRRSFRLARSEEPYPSCSFLSVSFPLSSFRLPWTAPFPTGSPPVRPGDFSDSPVCTADFFSFSCVAASTGRSPPFFFRLSQFFFSLRRSSAFYDVESRPLPGFYVRVPIFSFTRAPVRPDKRLPGRSAPPFSMSAFLPLSGKKWTQPRRALRSPLAGTVVVYHQSLCPQMRPPSFWSRELVRVRRARYTK